ncbi:MAG: DUF4332 domain-containing protein [Salinibacter sp.]
MAWIRNATRSVVHSVQGLAAGVWAAVATPLVHRPLRPLTKQALKGGLWLAHGAQSLLETTREEWDDLITEARTEIQSGDAPLRLGTETSTAGDAQHTNGKPTVEDAASRTDDEAAGTPARPALTAVKGIGEDYAHLLRAAGVSSVEQLADHDAGALREALREANDREALVGRVPSTDRVQGWIERAAGQVG